MRAALHRHQGWLFGAVLALLYSWTLMGLEMHSVNLAERWPQAVRILQLMVAEIEWTYTPDLLAKLRETVQIAVVGTTLAAVLAMPFGFWAAQHLAGARWVPASGKFVLNVIRTFPEIILAVMFIKAVGPGPFPGVLAMGVHSVGMLGKLYAEVVEAIDRDVLAAMSASGANRVQAIWHGILPQVLPEFASYAIYRFEINMRAAAVLGMVGAGGIGTPLIFAVLTRDWGRVGVILLGIIATVSVVDWCSAWLRSKLI